MVHFSILACNGSMLCVGDGTDELACSHGLGVCFHVPGTLACWIIYIIVVGVSF